MSQSSGIPALQGTQEGEEDLCILAAIRSQCSHSLWWAPRNEDVKTHRRLAPDSWAAFERSDFSEPRFLHLPIHRKVLSSLTWDIWFSLIQKILLMLGLLVLCFKLVYNQTPISTSLEQFSQGHLRCCLLGLSTINFCHIKHNFQLLGYVCFLSLHQ